MKRIVTIILSSVALFAGCEEFQPVFTGKYENPQEQIIYTDADFGNRFTSIADVKEMYKANGSKPYTIDKNCIIKGQVTTSDQVGNLYKSLYIQDESAGIEIKIGKNGLYNEYKLGQWIYVDCSGLTVGDYNGMINIGYRDFSGDYETGYLEHAYIIDSHVFKGEYADPVQPVVVKEGQLLKKENLGRLVTIENLTYTGEIFLLFYKNPNLSGEKKKEATNRFFASTDYNEAPKSYNIKTWALSEQLFKEQLYNGDFDSVERQDGAMLTSDYIKRDAEGNVLSCEIIPTAYAVSQYFKMGATEVQVRSSGFARFSDVKIPEAVLSGAAKVTFTGILTEYQGAAQFTLIDLSGVKKADGSPWYDSNNKEIK